MCSKVPNIVLNNCKKIPILGLGTWGSAPGEVSKAVKDAIDIGYRHIDCAHIYQNEHEVGEGVNAKLKEGTVKREELFITSKLWNTFHRADLVRGACEVTLKNLGLKYIDMYLIHWPMAYLEGAEVFPTNPDGSVKYSDADYVDTWKEMEKCVDAGLVMSIGLSNFNSKQIKRVLDVACIPPANLQVECHPYLNQKKLMQFCKSQNIAMTGYSPLGSPTRPAVLIKPDDPILMEDPKIIAIAEKYKKSVPQILIRYQLKRGNICIPKSIEKSQIAQNFDVFSFELADEDEECLDSLDRNQRYVGLVDEAGTHPLYPFCEEF